MAAINTFADWQNNIAPYKAGGHNFSEYASLPEYANNGDVQEILRSSPAYAGLTAAQLFDADANGQSKTATQGNPYANGGTSSLAPGAMPSVAAQEAGGTTADSAPATPNPAPSPQVTATSNYNPYASIPSNKGFVDHAPSQGAGGFENTLTADPGINALQGLRSARKTLY